MPTITDIKIWITGHMSLVIVGGIAFVLGALVF